jgi:hypothetical protein
MKTFRTVVILRQPHVDLWITMRDHLPEVASRVPDIESVTEAKRVVAIGRTHIVNEWRARYSLPAALSSLISPDNLGWTDRNSWDNDAYICTWEISPYIFTEHIRCQGRTVFESAMAGQGARITFEGSLDVHAGFLGIGTPVERLAIPLLESMVSTMIPRNFRITVEAAAAFAQHELAQPRKTL